MSNWNGKNISELNDAEAEILCNEIRSELIKTVAKTGGHLASNLGVVELTVALHRVYDFGKDRLVFDVGHQCYVHKMLTGRASEMKTLRQFRGISGFPKPYECDADAFIAGHASNSVSVALGMARARTLMKENYRVVALLGDGALTGGLAYEGLSDAGSSSEKILIILNDNGMSIKKSVGGISKLLAGQHLRPGYLKFKKIYRKILHKTPGGEHLYNLTHRIKKAIKGNILPSTFFEDMGFDYVGPVDGHDIADLTRILRWVDTLNGPVVMHVVTQKGKGYAPAEKTPEDYHGVGPFDPDVGIKKIDKQDFSDVFGRSLAELADENPLICAVTAAMQTGTGLDHFGAKHPERFFDVGIAEGHAVAMCAGMAKQGMIPVFAVYSTFLQRSYDMLLHDIALQSLHVVFGVDRAGIVGADGETHQGIFDLAFLSTVPHMTLLAPSNYAELRSMLKSAIYNYSSPVAIRYPRGCEKPSFTEDMTGEDDVILRNGSDITLVGYGILIPTLLEVADRLNIEGISCEVVKLNRLIPLTSECTEVSVRKTGRILVAEDVIAANSLGMALFGKLLECGLAIKNSILLNSGDTFVPHGSVEELQKMLGIDADSIIEKIREAFQ